MASRSALPRQFGLPNRLKIVDLLQPKPQTDPPSVGHTFCFRFPDLPRQKNPLPFFDLQPRFSYLPATHNRQVEDGRPLSFKFFWAHYLL